MNEHTIKIENKRLSRKSVYSFPDYKSVYIGKSFDASRRLHTFVVFDTETTGLDPEKEGIVQLSAVKYVNLKAVETWNTYLNPGCRISASAVSVNGITQEMVEHAPKISQVAADFMEFVGDAPIVGYNVKFDLQFMWCSGIDLVNGRDIYDVMLSAYGIFPKGSLPNRRLSTVAEALGIKFNVHDSLEDSIATGEILVRIVNCLCKPANKIPMDSYDLRKQMAMTYDEQVEYLLEKYGRAEYDYFLSENNLTKCKDISRTRDGLECHHIDENIIPTLSDPAVASQYSFDYQRKDRLVYCNYLEHLLLHIKIGRDRFFENHKKMTVRSDLTELITHGVNMLSRDINELYYNHGSEISWKQNCYEVIQDNYEDYVEILRDFQNYIVDHIALSEFSKPVYEGRKIIDEDTGNEGVITFVTEDEVFVETEKTLWIFRRSTFKVSKKLEEQLEKIRTILSDSEIGRIDSIYQDIDFNRNSLMQYDA